MRVVVVTGPGVVELNWMWLPTWVGMNTQLKAEIDKALRDEIVGKALTEETLDWVHDLVVNFLTTKFPGIRGFQEYFDSLKVIDVT